MAGHLPVGRARPAGLAADPAYAAALCGAGPSGEYPATGGSLLADPPAGDVPDDRRYRNQQLLQRDPPAEGDDDQHDRRQPAERLAGLRADLRALGFSGDGCCGCGLVDGHRIDLPDGMAGSSDAASSVPQGVRPVRLLALQHRQDLEPAEDRHARGRAVGGGHRHVGPVQQLADQPLRHGRHRRYADLLEAAGTVVDAGDRHRRGDQRGRRQGDRPGRPRTGPAPGAAGCDPVRRLHGDYGHGLRCAALPADRRIHQRHNRAGAGCQPDAAGSCLPNLRCHEHQFRQRPARGRRYQVAGGGAGGVFLWHGDPWRLAAGETGAGSGQLRPLDYVYDLCYPVEFNASVSLGTRCLEAH